MQNTDLLIQNIFYYLHYDKWISQNIKRFQGWLNNWEFEIIILSLKVNQNDTNNRQDNFHLKYDKSLLQK